MPPFAITDPNFQADYKALLSVAASLDALPDSPLEPVQNAFGTFLALWIECLEKQMEAGRFTAGLASLSGADVRDARSMRKAVAESLTLVL